MSTSQLVDIEVRKGYGSINDLRWDKVPPFAVLTGKNGAGKSQLLELIARTYGALAYDPRARHPHLGNPGLENSSVVIHGARFEHGEVFHSYSTWNPVGSGTATEDQVKQAIQQSLHRSVPNEEFSWFVRSLAARAGVSPEEAETFTPERVEAVVTPYMLWGRSLPSGSQSLAFLFLAYMLLEQLAVKNGASPEEVFRRLGQPPWDVLNSVLDAARLPFRVVEPNKPKAFSLVAPISYALQLRDIERRCDVPFDMLSSGEKVIMSMALWRFGVQEVGRHYKLLLLDEPDAHLHPSMTRGFLDVIQRVFVEEYGARVILTTHSPSTVALVPDESLFEMRRTGTDRIIRAHSRASAISLLTSGFVIAHEGMQLVLCEGELDAHFYAVVWERLTDRHGQEASKLEALPTLAFIHGKGLNVVRDVVAQVRAIGLSHFHGLIDLDDGNAATPGVQVLSRRALENYLFDPISVWCLLHEKGCAPSVPGLSVKIGQRGRVAFESQSTLQAIVDAVLEGPRARCGFGREARSVSFTNGVTLEYPDWFLDSDKVTLTRAFRASYPTLHVNISKELINSFAALDLIPTDLCDMFREIQRT